ncbi:hypothetical protein, partial [Massilia cavernae]|uniref:hypothetical protein n=1 Tax=Massilia cavernae TaxID=2320864 RepID=UPI001C71DC79
EGKHYSSFGLFAEVLIADSCLLTLLPFGLARPKKQHCRVAAGICPETSCEGCKQLLLRVWQC